MNNNRLSIENQICSFKKAIKSPQNEILINFLVFRTEDREKLLYHFYYDDNLELNVALWIMYYSYVNNM